MSYVRAYDILPDELLKEIQKYIQGEYIYIPNIDGIKKKWGQNSGSREYLKERNAKIYNQFLKGASYTHLSEEYCLSIDSVRKIVYHYRKKDGRVS